MKYLDIAHEPMIGATGKPVKVAGLNGDPNEVVESASVAQFLAAILEQYQAQMLQPPLTVHECGLLNKVVATLLAPGTDRIGFEDADFVVLKRAAPEIARYVSPRNAPIVAEILEKASRA